MHHVITYKNEECLLKRRGSLSRLDDLAKKLIRLFFLQPVFLL